MNIIDKLDEFKERFENISVSDFNSPEQNYENIEQISKKLLQVIPQKVYRFRPCTNYSIGALDKDEIWGTLASSLNDPMECQPYYDIDKINDIINNELRVQMVANNIKNFLDGHMPQFALDLFALVNIDTDAMLKILANANLEEVSKNGKSIIFSFFQERLEGITDTFWLQFLNFKNFLHIACFAENLHSTLMWSHYADSHKGFAVEYDMTKYVHECSKNCIDKNNCSSFHTNLQFAPILYSEHKYDATSTLRQVMEHEMMGEIYKAIPIIQNDANLYNGIIKEVDKLKLNKLILTKSADWSYEKEWRLFTYDTTNSQDIYKCISSKIIPSAVYLGSKISEEHRNMIIKICKSKQIPCYKMLNNYTTKEFKVYPDESSLA